MVAHRMQRVAVIFVVRADIDRVLAQLAVVRLTMPSPNVGHFDAIALPLDDLVQARRIVLARMACTLVDVHVTVARHVP